MRGNKRRKHRNNVHAKTRTRIVRDGEGFKIERVPFYKESLPEDRPPVTDLAMANRSGCLPWIFRKLIAARYGAPHPEHCNCRACRIARYDAQDAETKRLAGPFRDV